MNLKIPPPPKKKNTSQIAEPEVSLSLRTTSPLVCHLPCALCNEHPSTLVTWSCSGRSLNADPLIIRHGPLSGLKCLFSYFLGFPRLADIWHCVGHEAVSCLRNLIKTLLVHCLNILLPFPWQHWSAATWERGVMDDDRKTLGCPLVTFPMHPCFAAVSAVQCNVSGIGWYLHCNLHYGIPMHRSIAS